MTGTDTGAGPGRHGWRWDVALSFASEQRDYVEQVAEALKALGVKCFYDADEQINLWGKYLAEELPAIYGQQAAAVVLFVSADYAARDWTRPERRAALARAVRERREYVLPARFDDTPLAGLSPDMGWVDLRSRTPQQLATMVAAKLAALGILAASKAAARDQDATDTHRDDAQGIAADDDGAPIVAAPLDQPAARAASSQVPGEAPGTLTSIPDAVLAPSRHRPARPEVDVPASDERAEPGQARSDAADRPVRRRPVKPAAAGSLLVVAAIAAVVVITSMHGSGAAAAAVRLRDPRSSGVRSLAFDSADRTLAAGDNNGTTYLWNLARHTIIKPLPDPAGRSVSSVAFSPAGTVLAAGDLNGTTYLWNLARHTITKTLPDPHSKGVTAVIFGPHGTLAVGDGNGNTYIWDIAKPKIAKTLPDPHGKGITAIALGPGETILATADSNGATYLWNLATYTITKTLRDPGSGGIYSVAFNREGTTLAAADGNGSTDIWDLATPAATPAEYLPDPHAEGVYSVAFGKNGTSLASADGNGNVYLWHLTPRKITQTLRGPARNGIRCIALSKSFTILAAADSNGSTYLWTITNTSR